MTKNIYSKDGKQFIRKVEDSPQEGIDFCHLCGDDLYLRGGLACSSSKTGHFWIQYGDDT